MASSPAPVTASAVDEVLAHRHGPLLVLGGPGTGKTTLAVDLVAARIHEGLDPSQTLLMGASRRGVLSLRDRVAARVGRTIREPLARTAHSFAFGLLRREAAARAGPAPRLLGGAEQELMIAEMLAGSAHVWPDDLREAMTTRHGAASLRDLLLRAFERDLDPAGLSALGRAHGRAAWVSAGVFGAEYQAVTGLAHPAALDPAELVRSAVDLLSDDRALLEAERRSRSLIVVDDIDEADPAMLDLLELLAGGGGTLVATSDPDSTVFGFRGADPQAVRRFTDRFTAADGAPARQVVLEVGRRLPAPVLDVTARVAQRIGGPSSWRRLTPTTWDGVASVDVLAGAGDEMAHVAAFLRRRHLDHDVPWAQMAVVLRSSRDLSPVRRALARQGVPVQQRRDEVALWQQPPVRAMLDLLVLVAQPDQAAADGVLDLLLGPLGGLDPAGMVTVQRQLLSTGEVAGVEAVQQAVRSAVLDEAALPGQVTHPAVEALRETVAAGRAALARGEAVEGVLWVLWQSVGVAQRWRQAALEGRDDGAAADRDLDAVVALFDAAAAFTDRLPGAGPQAFLDHVRAQQIPGAGWAVSPLVADAVSVMTAHAAKGGEWDTVAVCRVHEDLWPDVRRRHTLLGTDDLVALLDTGRVPAPAEQASALLAAERRLFYVAVSRARSALLVTAVDDGESRPSRFVDELRPEAAEMLPVAASAVPTLPVLVAELRAAVCDLDRSDADRREAARLLAQLAAAGVRGATPDDWYGLAGPTDASGLFSPGEVQLSPSQVDGYLRCPLRWVLQRSGGDNGAVLRRTVGTLVHQLAAEAATGDWSAEQVWARFEELWQTVDAGRGWVARRERDRVAEMVERLVDWLERNDRECLGVEVEVSTELAGAQLRGRLDRVDRAADGTVVVVDFKTSTTPPSNAEASRDAQLGIYQWAVESGAVPLGSSGDEPAEGGEPSVRSGGGVLVHLGVRSRGTAREQGQPALSDSDDPRWPVGLVQQVVDGVTRSQFAAFVNPGCTTCPVRASCPAHPEGGRVVP